jgi:protein phosphatase
MVVYGHTPVPEAEWLNRTINVDTGCVFGGRLTALRYPELELVSVPAGRVYSEPARPIQPEGRAGLSAQQQQDELLDIEDVLGKRIIDTRLIPKITIREGNSAAALEVMSRFLIDPKWLIYLPPTMSPPETSHEPGLLEHPQQAFDYYRKHGVKKLICEEKHMGSRLVLVICRDEGTTLRRFGIAGQGIGMLYTRTGRRFFEDRLMETNLLAQVHAALTTGGFWEQFNTGWFCLDCELMPWSLKAQELIKGQYAAVGAASQAALAEALADLQQAAANGAPVEALRARFEDRAALAAAYTQAYRRYCWPVRSLEDIRLSPFHILATEGAVHTGQTHLWHMQTAVRLAEASPNSVLQPTGWIQVDVEEAESAAQGLCWWQELTGRGGEGMVVKPLDYVTYHRNRLIQPAIKCRGGEYLRIIYGAEYTLDEHLSRLRQRSLNLKRTLALREFALGIEALERFVNGEPLRRVHECVFGVLAMESEPVDPRL